MKNTTNPFTIATIFIEDQLQQIAYQVRTLENASIDEVDNISKKVKSAFRNIDRQHAQTKSLIISALFEYEPGVVQAFADSQLAHQLLGQKVQEQVKAFTARLSNAEKATAAALLIHQFNKYRLALHECLSREEVSLFPLLKRYYADTDLLKIKGQVEQTLIPQETHSASLDLVY